MKNELTNEIATKILQFRTGIMPEVCQLAMECNWGAPISGRQDTDYCLIWAAAKCAADAKVYLYGSHAGSPAWNIKTEMIPCGDLVNGYRLFKKELFSQYDFPEEYVILLEKDGQSFYDNNNEKNYYIQPYHGHTSTFILNGNTIYLFHGNLNYTAMAL